MPDDKTAAAKPTADELAKLKRDDLDKAAADAGVANPEALPNKDAVIDAIEEPNPALAPEPDPDSLPREHTYEVIGVQPTFDTAPGDQFTKTIPVEQERVLLAGGHIKRITKEG